MVAAEGAAAHLHARARALPGARREQRERADGRSGREARRSVAPRRKGMRRVLCDRRVERGLPRPQPDVSS